MKIDKKPPDPTKVFLDVVCNGTPPAPHRLP